MSFEDTARGGKNSHMVRPWDCPMSITGKQLLGSAIKSRCTVSCTPYEMPEEILGWSETRNMIRPLSAYGSSTRRVRRMVSLHPIVEEGMCVTGSNLIILHDCNLIKLSDPE